MWAWRSYGAARCRSYKTLPQIKDYTEHLIILERHFTQARVVVQSSYTLDLAVWSADDLVHII